MTGVFFILKTRQLAKKGKSTKKKTPVTKRKKGSGNWFVAILIALIFLLLVKGLFVEPYIVRTTNMGQTVLPGELIIINKTEYGVRLPITLLSFPFFGSSYYSGLVEFPYYRIPGSNKVNRFDPVFFNSPYEKEKPIDKRTQKISRVIGMPGDTLQVINSKIKINNSFTDISENKVYFNYTVIPDNSKINPEIFDKYEIYEGSKNDRNEIVISTSVKNFENLKNEQSIKKIVRSINLEINEILVFPNMQTYHWSMNDLGPLVVPGKNKKIILTHNNIAVYKDVIENIEKNKLEINESSFRINGEKTNEYTFKENYYFVLDDNRDNANDSRNWGFLPESHIIGKCSHICYSVDNWKEGKNKIRRARFFNKIE